MYAGTVVETADVRALFRTPLNPDTQELMRSIPKNLRRLEALRGVPVSLSYLVSPPADCRYHLRCPRAMAMEVYRQAAPVPVAFAPWHAVGCHLFSAT